MDPTVQAALQLLVTMGAGGIIVKLLDNWLEGRKLASVDQGKVTEDLWVQVKALKDWQTQTEKELDEWKERYWKLTAETNEVRAVNQDLSLQLLRMQERISSQDKEISDSRVKYEQLLAEHEKLKVSYRTLVRHIGEMNTVELLKQEIRALGAHEESGGEVKDDG